MCFSCLNIFQAFLMPGHRHIPGITLMRIICPSEIEMLPKFWCFGVYPDCIGFKVVLNLSIKIELSSLYEFLVSQQLPVQRVHSTTGRVRYVSSVMQTPIKN